MTTGQIEYSSEIIEHRWLSQKAFEIKLNCPETFNFNPGQWISLKYKNLERDYSLASAPDDSHLALCIRYVEDGQLSQILGDAEIGFRLSFSGPHGYFTFKPSPRPAVLVATGTGIAPFRSMVRSGVAPEFILHGVESSADFYYAEELQSASGSYVPCLSQSSKSQTYFKGRVTDYLGQNLPPKKYDFYLCGGREMIRDVTLMVDDLFEGSLVYTEAFY
ncbi:MAG: FAD-binding oxidoreductase [Desulfobacteraceae bacterium]|nr:FAD-binding oxidoreductase [Desulfobacteraceae bacterium]